MDYQEAIYIIDYFPRLMTEVERDTIKYYRFGYKIGKPENYESLDAYERKKGKVFSTFGVKENNETKNLIQDGFEQFVINIGKRIKEDTPEEYTLNKCPICNYLTRTPYAKQCRKCGHDWHAEIQGEFTFKTAFRIEGRPYLWIVGECLSGTFQIGSRIDLTNFQLNLIPEIKQIEVCSRSVDGTTKELPSFGIEVSLRQEEEIKKYVTKSAKPIMILKG